MMLTRFFERIRGDLIATASQKIMLTRFLERIRGDLIAAPTIDEPVRKMPQAAPKTDRPSAKAMPTYANPKGLIALKRHSQDSSKHVAPAVAVTVAAVLAAANVTSA